MSKMMNVIKNPNLNTSWLFRADILYDDSVQAQIGPTKSNIQIGPADGNTQIGSDSNTQFGPADDTQIGPADDTQPRVREIVNISRQRILVRTLVPRNALRDAPMNQTCTFHQSADDDGSINTLIIYIPHLDDADDFPFYHPRVRGIGHLHTWDPSLDTGTVSVHFLPFPGDSLEDTKTDRIAYHLLQLIYKHGQSHDHYVKRVYHDLVVPQARFQDRFAQLKARYARSLVESWAEVTDPEKHVFEDLSIAAFLIELWADMYRGADFPGFVDIGCGNGLLVYILNREGFSGWGFDARRRVSWTKYETAQPSSPSGRSLEQKLLLPYIIPDDDDGDSSEVIPSASTHDGRFPPGTFIISNHADELTPWTPILAAGSDCPFIMIPCCSHDLSGAKYRAPPPKDKSKGTSTYASLVAWATQIAEDCGFTVQTEMLRIPSTRNAGLLGSKRATTIELPVDLEAILAKYGGAGSYRATVAKLLKTGPRAH